MLVGLHTRGVPLAERLAAAIEGFEHETIPVGTLDIALHRDDLARLGTPPRVRRSRIPVDISDKQVVLGIVTTKRGALESKDDVKRRIEEASRYAPLDQLCLSPQCGFSSTVDGNALTHDEQLAKLALVVEVADEVWGR